MHNEIIINATPGETRVGILEKGQFTELHLERAESKSVVGSVVKGKVSRVLPGMQAAFVDIGLEKAAFLYAGDYVNDIEKLDPEDDEPRGGRGRSRNRRVAPIETLLREGEEIVVQIAKEPIGTKGARITSHVSIAGRHLVLTPWAQKVGVSRKIDSDKERRRLREIVKRVKPADLGFIIRTAGEAVREADLEADVRYLTTVWDDIQIKKEQVRAPEFLYSEPPLDLRVVRDFAGSETKRIVVDDPAAHQKMKDFLDRFVADPRPNLELFEGSAPIFDHFGIESQIDSNLGRKVWLKSGGYLIIDQSEALTAIDVNTGRYVGKRDLEETVFRTNLEAVREIVNQLRFRNIGGLIILDLIDMDSADNRDKVYRALQDLIRGDKAKTNILKISELGLVEMTRKRTRESLVQMLCEPCSYCEGKGYVLSDETVAHKVLREIRMDLPRFCGRKIAVTVSRRVAQRLLGPAAAQLRALEEELGREIEVRARAELHQEQFEVQALDDGPPMELDLPWLTDKAPAEEPKGRGKARKTEPKEAEKPAESAKDEEPEVAKAEEPEAAKAEEPKAARAEESEKAPEAEEPEKAEAAAPEALEEPVAAAEETADEPVAAAEETADEPVAAAEETADEPVAVETKAPARARRPRKPRSNGAEPKDEPDAPEGDATEASVLPPASVDGDSESPILQRSLEREDS